MQLVKSTTTRRRGRKLTKKMKALTGELTEESRKEEVEVMSQFSDWSDTLARSTLTSSVLSFFPSADLPFLTLTPLTPFHISQMSPFISEMDEFFKDSRIHVKGESNNKRKRVVKGQLTAFRAETKRDSMWHALDAIEVFCCWLTLSDELIRWWNTFLSSRNSFPSLSVLYDMQIEIAAMTASFNERFNHLCACLSLCLYLCSCSVMLYSVMSVSLRRQRKNWQAEA